MDNGYEIKPSHIMLPKRSTYVRRYDGETKWMHLLIEDEELLKKYNDIWEKDSAVIRKQFDSKPFYNKNDEATNFHDKEMPKTGSNHTCLAVITIDSVLERNENYYPQVFLKECKYIEKEK